MNANISKYGPGFFSNAYNYEDDQFDQNFTKNAAPLN